MQDGAELFTCIYSPRIFQKVSYYNANPMIVPRMEQINSKKYLINETMMRGLYWFYQDVRGRYMMVCMIICVVLYQIEKIKDIDEASDTYDTIDWLVKNVANNGNVGTWEFHIRDFMRLIHY
jgi:predicted acyl esterase